MSRWSDNWKSWRIPCDNCKTNDIVTHFCNPHAEESIKRFPCAGCGMPLHYDDYPNIDNSKDTLCPACLINPPEDYVDGQRHNRQDSRLLIRSQGNPNVESKQEGTKPDIDRLLRTVERLEQRAEAIPSWMKGTIVFADSPAKTITKAQRPPTPPSSTKGSIGERPLQLLSKVFKAWQNNCACGLYGGPITECPGPPTKREIEKIKEWMQDISQPIDIYPFSYPEVWETYL